MAHHTENLLGAETPASGSVFTRLRLLFGYRNRNHSRIFQVKQTVEPGQTQGNFEMKPRRITVVVAAEWVSPVQTILNRRIGLVFGIFVPGVFWILTGTALAQGSRFYVGVPVMAERLNVFYEKTVDNTDPRNISPSKGRVYRADDSSAGTAGDVGFLAGYRIPLGPSGVFLSGEGDLTFPSGAVQGHFDGAGASESRSQLGENWPEDWSFEKNRSYGLTVRLGAGISMFSGLSVYALAGLRRLDATLSADYVGCFSSELCTTAEEFTSGTFKYDEDFTGWTTGGGLEKRLGNAAIRGELRYTDYRSAGRIVPYDDLGIKVPIGLEADGIGLLVSLLWYF